MKNVCMISTPNIKFHRKASAMDAFRQGHFVTSKSLIIKLFSHHASVSVSSFSSLNFDFQSANRPRWSSHPLAL